MGSLIYLFIYLLLLFFFCGVRIAQFSVLVVFAFLVYNVTRVSGLSFGFLYHVFAGYEISYNGRNTNSKESNQKQLVNNYLYRKCNMKIDLIKRSMDVPTGSMLAANRMYLNHRKYLSSYNYPDVCISWRFFQTLFASVWLISLLSLVVFVSTNVM